MSKHYYKRRTKEGGFFYFKPPKGYRLCSRCNKVKKETIKNFHIRKPSGYWASYCIPCAHAYGSEYHHKNPPPRSRIVKNTRHITEVRRQQRRDALTLLGGKCECCGESIWQFLAIDHRYGHGNTERKRLKKNGVKHTGRYAILEVLTMKSPLKKYRALCHNCNNARGYYGYCPHRKKGKVEVVPTDD